MTDGDITQKQILKLNVIEYVDAGCSAQTTVTDVNQSSHEGKILDISRFIQRYDSILKLNCFCLYRV